MNLKKIFVLTMTLLSVPTFAYVEETVPLDDYFSVGKEVLFSADQRLAENKSETIIDDSQLIECVLRHDELSENIINAGTLMKIKSVEKYSYAKDSWASRKSMFIDITEIKIKLESSINLSINCYKKLQPGSVIRSRPGVFTKYTQKEVPTIKEIQDFLGKGLELPLVSQ